MSVLPERIALVREWLKKASHDLKNAEHTLTLPDSECPFDTVCFHAQQCAEKSLKAFLTAHGVEFEKIHELGQLLQQCSMAPDLIRELDEIDSLSPYAVEGRYPDEPGEEEPIFRDKAEEALSLARKTYELVRNKLAPLID